MEKSEYEVMFNVEDDYWWYIGLRDTVFSFIAKFFPKLEGLKLLDAGCGTGASLARSPVHPAYGFDISEEALRYCRIRNLKNIVAASVCDIPFLNDTFDAVISLDVLSQIDNREAKGALNELYRTLNDNGIILLNLPAFNFLYSRHDVAVHIRKRYRRKEFRRMMIEAGFEVERLTYRNSFLFPLFVMIRMISAVSIKKETEVKSDLKQLPRSINSFLAFLLDLENRIILSGINFPFGLSLFCLARKKSTNSL